jgi:hypothetical protein
MDKKSSKIRSTESIKAAQRLEKVLRDNQIILEKYSQDGTVMGEGLFKFEITCWIHPEEIEIYEKQTKL